MKVHRVTTGVAGPAAGVNAPLRPAAPPRTGFEATVSDQGVTIGRRGQAAPENERQGGAQVTSSASLQQVLSAEEIQALIRQFAAERAPAAAADAGRSAVYSGRGATRPAPEDKIQGRLVDLIG